MFVLITVYFFLVTRPKQARTTCRWTTNTQEFQAKYGKWNKWKETEIWKTQSQGMFPSIYTYKHCNCAHKIMYCHEWSRQVLTVANWRSIVIGVKNNECGKEWVCWTSAGDYRNIMLGLSSQIIKETQVIKPVRPKISHAYLWQAFCLFRGRWFYCDNIVESGVCLPVYGCKFHLFWVTNLCVVCNCWMGRNGVVFCLSVLENCCYSN